MGALTEEVLIKIMQSQLHKKIPLALHVNGWSMEPCLRPGDCVRIDEAEKLEAGDIAVFLYCGSLLVHRILDVNGVMLCCKGDNAYHFELVPASMVLGTVTGILADTEDIESVRPLPRVRQEFIDLSANVGLEFMKRGGELMELQRSAVYKQYQKCVREHFINR